MRLLRWLDRNMHRYMTSMLLLMGLLYAAIDSLNYKNFYGG